MHFLMRNTLLVSAAFAFQNALLAQDKLPIKFGKVTLEDFNVQSPLIDSSTNAVIVADAGSSEFIANTTELSFSLVFKEKKRIKIINKNGFDAATVIIPLYVGGNSKSEKLTYLDAFTYNIENGKVVSTKVDKSSLFTEKKNDYWTLRKFTFPALKEGSIIEYSYEIKSDFFFNLRDWTFQNHYPTLWSQYEAAIPEFYKFIILSQGYQAFAVDKVDKSQTSFSFTEHVDVSPGLSSLSNPNNVGSRNEHFTIDGSIDNHTWIMKNVPALKEEPFTTTIENAVSKIEFQLQQIAYPHSIPQNVMNSWEKASEGLKEHEHFGVLINRPNNWLDNDVAAIVTGITSEDEKIKKIYEHVRDNFTCTNYSGYLVTTSLKDVMKNKSGSVADINMLLIAMLRTQDIVANPVLLSTRAHGYTNEIYPLMDKYNYVVVQVSSGNNAYFLDASVPRLGFNKLPPKVYNGQARVITKSTADAVYIAADSLNETNLASVFIENSDNGLVQGFFTGNKGYISSLDIRDEVAKSGMDEYGKAIKTAFSDEIELSDIQVDSLKKLDEPVALKYNLKFTGFGEADIIYFNPMLGEAVKKNPFAAAVRNYPVEMPYTQDNIYSLSMEMPKGYKVDELPKSVRLMLNGDEGMFEYIISADEARVQMRCRLQVKKTFFPNEDYQTLRDFYAYIVKKEAEQIVFKKTR